jgi:hypothetical protein
MSSADFRKVLIEDQRMRVTDSLPFGVVKSGQNVTTQIYPATSQSASSQTYSIQTPSEVTLLDRNIVWQSTYEIEIRGTPAAGEFLVDLGNRDALAPLPLHMSATTLQVQVNNNSVSVNIRDVLPQLLRMYGDDRALQRWNGIAPLAPDTYRSYGDQLGANNNSNGSWAQTADNSLISRGSFSIDSLEQTTPAIGAGEKNRQTVGDGSVASGLRVVKIRFTSLEPLFLSPFHFANLSANQMAIYGVSNLNFIFNISAQANRLWRCGAAEGVVNLAGVTVSGISGYSVSVTNVSGSRLIFQMLTPHPSQILPSKNVVDYVDFPRYLTTFTSTIGAAAVSALNELVPTTTVFSSNNIQLNQVPDMLVICARKPMSQQTNRDSDSFFPITGISINWNNQSGLLANATQDTLYRMSAKSTNQTWQEFKGYANKYQPPLGATYDTQLQQVLTSGSILALRFGQDIPIVEEFYAAGSLGSFNLQFNVTLQNYQQSAQQVELVLMCVNSGLFITSQGVSSTYTGILTKSDVLSASEMKPVSERHLRLVGGVESSALNGCADIAPKAQEAIMDAVSAAKSALGKGMGVSGGADGIGGRMKLASRC